MLNILGESFHEKAGECKPVGVRIKELGRDVA
jgi:hypothetical protein